MFLIQTFCVDTGDYKRNISEAKMRNKLDFHYKCAKDFCMEKIGAWNSTLWAEWEIYDNYSKKLHDWELVDDAEYGVIVLEHKPRGFKSTLTSDKWLLEFPNKNSFIYKRGKWFAAPPKEIIPRIINFDQLINTTAAKI